MDCSNPRQSDEARVKAALEKMDDVALKTMADMMEKMAEKHPRLPLPIVKSIIEK